MSPKNLPFGAYKQKKKTYVMAILKHRKLVFGTALSSAHFYSILTFSPGTNIVYKGER